MTDLATRSGRWPAGAQQLQDAFDRLDRQCVKGAGFRLPASPGASLPVPEDEAAAIDLDGRRRHGYGISVHDHGSTAAAAPDAYTSSLSVRDQKRLAEAQFGPGEQRTAVTLNGKGRVTVPSAGCVARTRTKLAGDVQAFAQIFYAPQQFDDQLNRTAPKDTSYQAALGRWRACMANKGYTYASPDAATTQLRQEYERRAGGAHFRHLEISVAVADGECESRTHLPTALLGVRRNLVARLPAGDLSYLRSVTTSWESAVTHARRALA
ncbi:MAG: hypothetical protein ACRDP6_10980 [Actinoallomurus sp.]